MGFRKTSCLSSEPQEDLGIPETCSLAGTAGRRNNHPPWKSRSCRRSTLKSIRSTDAIQDRGSQSF